jgi:hypothetical protein
MQDASEYCRRCICISVSILNRRKKKNTCVFFATHINVRADCLASVGNTVALYANDVIKKLIHLGCLRWQGVMVMSYLSF